ncbi:hypothetical protein C84B14_08602 [Salinisphaera sp. C84B14]|uniref:hypothetical protein n=1 Tax=Salinisphaera sp. C84B14 TaxID=1304155 RepID=UPI0033406569
MNTLQSHEEEFEAGTVTESGYAALDDAEGYGAASSVGSGSVSIDKVWQAYRQGRSLWLYCKDKLMFQPNTEDELADWCENNFPACYGEYLRRKKH